MVILVHDPRMRFRFALLAVLASSLATACASESKHAEPEFVRVTIVSATIGPTKIDGSRWDALTALPNLAAAVVTESGGSTGGAIVAAHVTGEMLAPFEKPDPEGWAELDGERRSLACGGGDTLTPQWSTSATFAHVRLSDAARLRIHLEDRDPLGNEPIGDVELHGGVMLAALERGGVYQARVDDQTHGQVLTVGITVAPEPSARSAAAF
jgi:hypothetical protein